MSQAQRIEVITKVERRRRFTDEEKLRLIEEALAPGGSMRSVADRHGIDRRLLYSWKSRLKRLGMLVPTAVAIRSVARDEKAAFLPVATLREEPPAEIRVSLGDDTHLSFPVAMCPKRLAAIVHALRA